MEQRGDGVPIIRREAKELSGSLPEFRLVDGAKLCLTIPSAQVQPWDLFRSGFAKDPAATAIITVRSGERLLDGAHVLVLLPNRTWKRATADENGEAAVDLPAVDVPLTVFAAAAGFSAGLERDWIPARRPLTLDLAALPEGGSVIFPESAGQIPGLAGRLNPHRD